jgi:hypothetical protein
MHSDSLLFVLAAFFFFFVWTTVLSTSTPTVDHTAGSFSVTSFLNSGSPHSIEARLSFTLSSSCLVAPLANTTCTYSQSVQPTIATSSQAVGCSDPSVFVTFEYITAGNSYYLSVTHLSNQNQTVDTGMLYLGANVTTMVDELKPNGDFQMLVHEPDFDIGYNRADECC